MSEEKKMAIEETSTELSEADLEQVTGGLIGLLNVADKQGSTESLVPAVQIFQKI